MRFYVIRCEWNKVANAENREMYAFDTRDKAVAKFHSIMGSDINNATLSKALCVVLDGNGNTIAREVWEASEEA